MKTKSTRTTDCHTAFSTLWLCRQVHVQLTVTPPSPHVAVQTTSTRTTVTLPFGCANNKHTYNCHIAIWLSAFSTCGCADNKHRYNCHIAIWICRQQAHVQLSHCHLAVQTTSTRTTVTLPFGCADNKHTYNCHIAIWLCRQQAHVQLSHCHLAVQTTSTRTTVTPPSPHVAVQTTNTCIAHCHTARSHTVAVWATSTHTIDCHTTMWLCRQAHVQLTVTLPCGCADKHTYN